MGARTIEPATVDVRVHDALAWLARRGRKKNVDGMARYGIRAEKVFGVSVADLRGLAKRLGRDHELAQALWATGWYEGRMLAAFVDEPDRVSPAQMDRWARAFDNWAICDTICFHLFDRTPHAWRKAATWAGRRDEFVKRAGFALIASLALHDKRAPDARFLKLLPVIEREASDDRSFVKKAVNWALRSIGNRNRTLHTAAKETSRRLASSDSSAARWVGRDALKQLDSAATAKRLSR